MPIRWKPAAAIVLAAMVRTVAPAEIAGTAALAAPADAPGAREVTGYVDAERSGASKTWTLPAGTPYLYVPFVGADVGGAIAAVDAGAGVGVALFQLPYFASRDVGCQPVVGTDARPDLMWLGPTAWFAPGPPEQPAAPVTYRGAPADYSSLIVFDRRLGPPPGALILDRRRTIGIRCRNATHKTLYNRLFVPMARPPAAEHCFDLTGTYRTEGSSTTTLAFATSDRVVLLSPADLADRYGSIRHRISATLFEGPGCRGNSIVFDSAQSVTRVFRLGDFDFRDRARSILLAYDSGPIAPFVARPAGEQPTAAAERAVPAAPSEPPQGPAGEPSVPDAAAAPAAESAPSPPRQEARQAAPTSEAEAEPEAIPSPATEPEPPATAATLERASETSARPAPRLSALRAEPDVVPEQAAPAAARPAREQPRPASQPSPRGVQQAMPKLMPIMPPPPGDATTPSADRQTFRFPVHDIYRLNFCLHWGKDCGEPAAIAWCKSQGYQRAAEWRIDEDIGGLFPTIVLGDKRVCSNFVCDGFQEITCAQ